MDAAGKNGLSPITYKQRYIDAMEAVSASSLSAHSSSLFHDINNIEQTIGSLKQRDSDPELVHTAIELLRRKSDLLFEARVAIAHNPLVLKNLQLEFARAIDLLEQFPDIEHNYPGVPKSPFVKKFYRDSREETRRRFEPMDHLLAVGQEYYFDEPDSEKRSFFQVLVPRDIRVAQWRLLLDVASKLYEINIPFMDDKEQGIDPYYIDVFAYLYSYLAEHERGKSNPHMPDTHKLRHNGAIHSVHTMGLIDKMFHIGERKIEHGDGKESEKVQLQGMIKRMRSQVMTMAALHDMGELDGELSEGIEVAYMERGRAEFLSDERHKLEEDVFKKHLARSRKALTQPVTDAQWQVISGFLLDAYQAGEDKSTFMGRFLKVVERMQSQQDYLRFNGHGDALPLRDSTEENRRFSINYVPSVLFDDKNGYLAYQHGPKSLFHLAKQGNADEQMIYGLLYEAAFAEFQHLHQQNARAYGADVTRIFLPFAPGDKPTALASLTHREREHAKRANRSVAELEL